MYLEAERLRELLPDAVRGDPWTIAPNALAYPQLERLDDQSWLFVLSGPDEAVRCMAVLRKPLIEHKTFMGGVAIVCNRDITHLLPRLGCTTSIAQWAAVPRVVPPSDLDLLCYALGISDDDDNIPPVTPDDERTRELRAAVWEAPHSDDASRMVYADYLQDRGDPRGELVALQVTRARTGEPASDREHQLVRRIGPDCAQPLTPYLAPGLVLERGFVAKCTVNDVVMPDAIAQHIAWRTVDDVTTTNGSLLINPHLRARRAGMGGSQLVDLVEHVRPLPFETIVGLARRGVAMEPRRWNQVARIGALTALRVLSVDPEVHGVGPSLVPALLRSPLGAQLAQLDAFIELEFADPQRWRDAFDLAPTPVLSIRFAPIAADRGTRLWIGTEVLVALRRTASEPHLIIQLYDVLGAETVTLLMRFVAQLSRAIHQAEIHDFGAPAARIPERHATLLERMRAMFPQVLVQPPGATPLSP